MSPALRILPIVSLALIKLLKSGVLFLSTGVGTPMIWKSESFASSMSEVKFKFSRFSRSLELTSSVLSCPDFRS